MLNLTIKQLVEITKGELVFGSMPPLDGGLHGIRRMIPAGEKVLEGDVVAVGGTLGSTSEGFAESFFMQGAKGLLSSRSVTPWDGCFAIRVPCVRTALSELAAWSRRRFSGVMVGVVEGQTESGLAGQLAALSGEANIGQAEAATTPDLLWRMLALRSEAAVEVVSICLPNCCDRAIAIAAPDVIVVPPPCPSDVDTTSLGDTVCLDVGLAMLNPVIGRGTTVVAPRSNTAWQSLAEKRGSSLQLYENSEVASVVACVRAAIVQAITRQLELETA